MKLLSLILFILLFSIAAPIAMLITLRPVWMPEEIPETKIKQLVKVKWKKRYESRSSWAGAGWITLHLELDYIPEMFSGDSQVISVMPILLSARPEGSSRGFNESEVLREAAGQLSNGGMILTLNLPNTEQMPRELSSLENRKTSKWSVRFPNEGRVSGFVGISIPHRSTQRVAIVDEPEIEILVRKKFLTTENILKLLAIILGPLISIPGIIAFWRSFKSTNGDDNDRPRIILP